MPGKKVWAVSVWAKDNKIHCTVDTESTAGDPGGCGCLLEESQVKPLLTKLNDAVIEGVGCFRPFWGPPGWVWQRYADR